MKKLSQILGGVLAVVAVLVFMTAAGSAQTLDKTVFRSSYPGETHSGYALKAWEPSVTITEPEKVAPIVVTFSTSYRATTPFYVGLRLNDGPCVFNGPSTVQQYFPDDWSSTSVTMQWVIMPGDYKLQTGTNVITVCGGSATFGSNGTITLGFTTLNASLVKQSPRYVPEVEE